MFIVLEPRVLQSIISLLSLGTLWCYTASLSTIKDLPTTAWVR
jgi:hypothetical protein